MELEPDFQNLCCLGDSIAVGCWDGRGIGWFGRLQEKLAAVAPQRYISNNLSKDGDRTLDTFHRLCGEALTRDATTVIIAIGINDLIRAPEKDADCYVSAQLRMETWQRLLDMAKRNIPKVLVVGLLPCVEEMFPGDGYNGTPYWNLNSDTVVYNAQIKQWCEALEIPFLDVFESWQKHERFKELYTDASHPNTEGHELLSTQVFEKFQQLGWA